MIDYYFGEQPILDNVRTYDLADADVRADALDLIDALVWKPVDGSGGYGLVIGPSATEAALEELRASVLDDPRGWIAQDPVALSTAPTYVDGAMRPRHVDLRPFALHDGTNVSVVPGGLTRVALPEGSLIVNSSQGGGSKDTWVLAGAARRRRRTRSARLAARRAHAPSRRSRSARARVGGRPATTAAAAMRRRPC